MSPWPRIVFLIACAGLLGCARGSSVPPTTPEPYTVNAMNVERLDALAAHAPELAEHIARLHAMAQSHGQRGERDAAQEMATLAEVSLLSAELAFARTPVCEPPLETTDEEPTSTEVAVNAAEPSNTSPRRRPRAVREEPAEEPEEVPSPPEALRTRLAEMASVLARMEPSSEVEQVQRVLIEADRALADGLMERAAELAEEARAVLSGQRMRGVPDETAFIRDAQERLGSRALRRGSRILVRLNEIVSFANGRWTTRDASTMSSLRALARVYDGERLLVVHMAEEDDSSFVQSEDELIAYLRERMQLSEDRLAVPRRQASGSPGTYLVFRPESE